MPRILIHGSGAREHALAALLEKEGHDIYVTPGNLGMFINHINPLTFNLEIDPFDLEIFSNDQDLVAGKAENNQFAPLSFGPNKLAAQLEGSKLWCKEILKAVGIPHAKAQVLNLDNISTLQSVGVLKFDGLAMGKGVFLPPDLDSLKTEAKNWLTSNPFGEGEIFVEEKLSGFESSIFLLCNEKNVVYVGSAQDFKRRYDQNLGPNTGGMGSISPHPKEDKNLWPKIFEDYGQKIVQELQKRGIVYRGFMYLGVMWHKNVPHILEINVRLGDPEAQSLLSRIDVQQSHIFQALKDCAEGKMINPSFLSFMNDQVAITVVGVQRDYPIKKPESINIDLIDLIRSDVYWSGVSPTNSSQGIIASGRIASCVGLGKNFSEAKAQTYKIIQSLEKIFKWDYRHDIGP